MGPDSKLAKTASFSASFNLADNVNPEVWEVARKTLNAANDVAAIADTVIDIVKPIIGIIDALRDGDSNLWALVEPLMSPILEALAEFIEEISKAGIYFKLIPPELDYLINNKASTASAVELIAKKAAAALRENGTSAPPFIRGDYLAGSLNFLTMDAKGVGGLLVLLKKLQQLLSPDGEDDGSLVGLPSFSRGRQVWQKNPKTGEYGDAIELQWGYPVSFVSDAWTPERYSVYRSSSKNQLHRRNAKGVDSKAGDMGVFVGYVDSSAFNTNSFLDFSITIGESYTYYVYPADLDGTFLSEVATVIEVSARTTAECNPIDINRYIPNIGGDPLSAKDFLAGKWQHVTLGTIFGKNIVNSMTSIYAWAASALNASKGGNRIYGAMLEEAEEFVESTQEVICLLKDMLRFIQEFKIAVSGYSVNFATTEGKEAIASFLETLQPPEDLIKLKQAEIEAAEKLAKDIVATDGGAKFASARYDKVDLKWQDLSIGLLVLTGIPSPERVFSATKDETEDKIDKADVAWIKGLEATFNASSHQLTCESKLANDVFNNTTKLSREAYNEAMLGILEAMSWLFKGSDDK